MVSILQWEQQERSFFFVPNLSFSTCLSASFFEVFSSLSFILFISYLWACDEIEGALWNPCSEVRGRPSLLPSHPSVSPSIVCVFLFLRLTVCLCSYKHKELIVCPCVCFLPPHFRILHPSVSCWLSVHTSASVSYHLWECQLCVCVCECVCVPVSAC